MPGSTCEVINIVSSVVSFQSRSRNSKSIVFLKVSPLCTTLDMKVFPFFQSFLRGWLPESSDEYLTWTSQWAALFPLCRRRRVSDVTAPGRQLGKVVRTPRKRRDLVPKFCT